MDFHLLAELAATYDRLVKKPGAFEARFKQLAAEHQSRRAVLGSRGPRGGGSYSPMPTPNREQVLVEAFAEFARALESGARWPLSEPEPFKRPAKGTESALAIGTGIEAAAAAPPEKQKSATPHLEQYERLLASSPAAAGWYYRDHGDAICEEQARRHSKEV